MNNFSDLADLLSERPSPSVSRTTTTPTPLAVLSKKEIKTRAPELLIDALDGNGSIDDLTLLAARLNQGALSKPIATRNGRSPLSALLDNFTSERAKTLQPSLRSSQDGGPLLKEVQRLLTERPDHPALTWLFNDLLAADLAARHTLPAENREAFWRTGPSQLWRGVFAALDHLATTDPNAFAAACRAAGEGLSQFAVMDGGNSKQASWRKTDTDTEFCQFKPLTAFDAAVRSKSPVALDALLLSPMAFAFMGSVFRSASNQQPDFETERAFSLVNTGSSWPADAFRFLFRHLADHQNPDVPAAFSVASKKAILVGEIDFFTSTHTNRIEASTTSRVSLIDLLHRPLSPPDELVLTDLSRFRFRLGEFKEYALILNVNLIQELLARPDSARTVFDVWDQHPHAPLAFFSSFRPTAAAALFLAHKDVLSTWRSPNGSTALHYAVAAMTPFEASRQALLAVLDGCPDLASVRNNAGQTPDSLIVDEDIKIAVSRRLMARSVPDTVKSSARRTAKAPMNQRRM